MGTPVKSRQGPHSSARRGDETRKRSKARPSREQDDNGLGSSQRSDLTAIDSPNSSQLTAFNSSFTHDQDDNGLRPTGILSDESGREREDNRGDKGNKRGRDANGEKGHSRRGIGRRNAPLKLDGIKPNDLSVAKIARTILLSRMVHGEMIDNHSINPWTPTYDDVFMRLALTSWTQARSEFNEEHRRHITKAPYPAIVDFLRNEPVAFRTQTMRRARDVAQAAYGLDGTQIARSSRISAMLTNDFCFISKDPEKADEKQFLHNAIPRILSATLWGKTQDGLARLPGGGQYFEKLSGTTVCFVCAQLWWALKEWETGSRHTQSASAGLLQSPYLTLLHQWEAQAERRQTVVGEKIMNRVRTCVRRPKEKDARMPITQNKYANNLDDLSEDGEVEPSTVYQDSNAGDGVVARGDSTQIDMSPATDTALSNANAAGREASISEVGRFDDVHEASREKSKSGGRGKHLKVVAGRPVELERIDGSTHRIQVGKSTTIEELRDMCMVNDKAIVIWENDKIIESKRDMEVFIKRLWSKSPRRIQLHRWPGDKDDETELFFNGDMNGAPRG